MVGQSCQILEHTLLQKQINENQGPPLICTINKINKQFLYSISYLKMCSRSSVIMKRSIAKAQLENTTTFDRN